MEVNILSQIFPSSGRPGPLLVGSVKSNVGHTEASSSLVSVSKALVSLDSGLIPPNLGYTEPNPAAGALVSGEVKVRILGGCTGREVPQKRILAHFCVQYGGKGNPAYKGIKQVARVSSPTRGRRFVLINLTLS